jgi:hypothetical protein
MDNNVVDAVRHNHHRRLIDIPPISESNMISAGSKRVFITIPNVVKDWLQGRAIYNGGTQSGEIVQCVREKMEREAARATGDA